MTRYRKMLSAKIHRATVTHADLDYEGSLTLAPKLMEAADFFEFEAVHVWNVTRGTRFETYIIQGEPESTTICVNGAAAHLAAPGDTIIIATFIELPESEAQTHKPKAIFVDKNNRQIDRRPEIPGPQRASRRSSSIAN